MVLLGAYVLDFRKYHSATKITIPPVSGRHCAYPFFVLHLTASYWMISVLNLSWEFHMACGRRYLDMFRAASGCNTCG